MRPTRWRSPSAMPVIVAVRRCCPRAEHGGRACHEAPGIGGPAVSTHSDMAPPRTMATMIGKLKGIVDAVGEAHAIIDVGGVGYEVQASARTLRSFQMGEEVSLAIETHVREDAIRLFGFTSELERAWFRSLQTIQGVGAKLALAVLGTLSTQDLANAIALQDWAAVEQSPGVGK